MYKISHYSLATENLILFPFKIFLNSLQKLQLSPFSIGEYNTIFEHLTLNLTNIKPWKHPTAWNSEPRECPTQDVGTWEQWHLWQIGTLGIANLLLIDNNWKTSMTQNIEAWEQWVPGPSGRGPSVYMRCVFFNGKSAETCLRWLHHRKILKT